MCGNGLLGLLPLTTALSPRTLSPNPCPLDPRLKAWSLKYLPQNPLDCTVTGFPGPTPDLWNLCLWGLSPGISCFWQTKVGTRTILISVRAQDQLATCSRRPLSAREESCWGLSRWLASHLLSRTAEVSALPSRDSECLSSPLSSLCSLPLPKNDFWRESHFCLEVPLKI